MNAQGTVSVLALVLGAGLAAGDTNPALFPDKAQAILLSGSTEARFTNDINSMRRVLTSDANRWQYGDVNVKSLTFGGAGAGRATWANLRTELTSAAERMWVKPAREQNFVYIHSSHGVPGGADGVASKTRSRMDFGDGYRTSSEFASLITTNLRSGHTANSSNGSTTSCVRTMTFVLEPCYSGGQIYDLTETLASKENRRKYFPALSDVTVLTAAKWDETSYGLADESGNRFMREFYGYGATTGALEGNAQRTVWSAYQTAAQRNVANNGTAWASNFGFGSGQNAVKHVASTASDGRAKPEHNLYRHVQFYPSVTYGESVDGETILPEGGATLDFRLDGGARPISGPLPMVLSLNDTVDGRIRADRDRLPIFNAALPVGLGFVEYYTFNLTLLGGATFTTGNMRLEMESDDAAAAARRGSLRLFRYDGRQWVNTGAAWDQASKSFSLDGLADLGTYAVVVPAPGVGVLAGFAMALVAVRRRR